MVKVREAEESLQGVEGTPARRVEVDHVRFAVRRSESGLFRHEAQKYVFELRRGKSVFVR